MVFNFKFCVGDDCYLISEICCLKFFLIIVIIIRFVYCIVEEVESIEFCFVNVIVVIIF